eukprot:scaffold23542_cov147-Cylindrotheca_fusiformis.AAC.3
MVKRKRSDVPSWWAEIIRDVTTRGGFVHPSLEFTVGNRKMSLNQRTPAQTMILRIPRSALVTVANATTMTPWLNRVQESIAELKLHNPLPDLLLAFVLAHEKSSYLETLPPASSWDCLPRRWNNDQIKRYLKGSPIVPRVKRDKVGVRSDYDELSKLWKGSEPPSFGAFDDMLAAVTSRGFEDSKEKIVMVPILDLCDHSRGKGGQKNLTYQTLDDGSLEVTTTRQVEAHEGLRLTYGAQGNAQLLLNYGFAIPKNLEPDGSSNDFVEFSCDGENTVNLKTGPKAVLEQLLDSKADPESEATHQLNDMAAFLKACDGGGSDEIDIYDNEIEEEPQDNIDDDKEIRLQLEALEKLKATILKRINLYGDTGRNLRQRLSQAEKSLDYFAALLLQSEQRCLFFFYRAAQKVESLLHKNDCSALEPPKRMKELPLDMDDKELIEQQTDELAAAYMKIRHGD